MWRGETLDAELACVVIDVGDAKVLVLAIIFAGGSIQPILERGRYVSQLTLFPIVLSSMRHGRLNADEG